MCKKSTLLHFSLRFKKMPPWLQLKRGQNLLVICKKDFDEIQYAHTHHINIAEGVKQKLRNNGRRNRVKETGKPAKAKPKNALQVICFKEQTCIQSKNLSLIVFALRVQGVLTGRSKLEVLGTPKRPLSQKKRRPKEVQRRLHELIRRSEKAGLRVSCWVFRCLDGGFERSLPVVLASLPWCFMVFCFWVFMRFVDSWYTTCFLMFAKQDPPVWVAFYFGF